MMLATAPNSAIAGYQGPGTIVSQLLGVLLPHLDCNDAITHTPDGEADGNVSTGFTLRLHYTGGAGTGVAVHVTVLRRRSDDGGGGNAEDTADVVAVGSIPTRSTGTERNLGQGVVALDVAWEKTVDGGDNNALQATTAAMCHADVYFQFRLAPGVTLFAFEIA